MEYRPNPILSTLMTQLKKIRKSSDVTTIAWIYHYEPGDIDLHDAGEYQFGFASKRAWELGYQLDPFWIQASQGPLWEPSKGALSVKKLNQTLFARNIQGVILVPWVKNKTFLKKIGGPPILDT